jgi:hypothetical protein
VPQERATSAAAQSAAESSRAARKTEVLGLRQSQMGSHRWDCELDNLVLPIGTTDRYYQHFWHFWGTSAALLVICFHRL